MGDISVATISKEIPRALKGRQYGNDSDNEILTIQEAHQNAALSGLGKPFFAYFSTKMSPILGLEHSNDLTGGCLYMQGAVTPVIESHSIAGYFFR
jgi:hypothetical protein